MELSEDFVGCVVTIQLARPLYVIDYAGHVKFHGHEAQLLGEPIVQGSGEQAKPLVMDLLLGVIVREVHKDHLLVEMITPGNNRSLVTVPTSLLMQVTEIIAFEPDDLPVVTRQVRQPAGKPLVQL